MEKVLLYDYPSSICSQMARLALVEKGVAFTRRTVDIMETREQFEPWYVALNPKAVVPTLRIGERIVTDTVKIVAEVDAHFDGPVLSPADPEPMQRIMAQIMALHYGVLLYSGHPVEEGISPTIIARGEMLKQMLEAAPDQAELLGGRIAGNARMQGILADQALVEEHVGAAREVVSDLDDALARTEFTAAGHYTLADTFATAALARFHMHGFQGWWTDGENPNVSRYYDAVKARPSWAAAGVVESREA